MQSVGRFRSDLGEAERVVGADGGPACVVRRPEEAGARFAARCAPQAGSLDTGVPHRMRAYT